MAVSLSLAITQNSQSIGTNLSNVTVKLTANWTYGSWDHNGYLKTCTIDGTAYDLSSKKINPNKTTSGSEVIFEKTLNISHNSDGTKTLSVSASVKTATSSGTVTASASKTLTTIARKSSLSVANGTLGTAQTLTISELATAFNHKLKYVCGSASGYILGSASATSSTLSTNWTPPLSLAAQNTTGTSVSITFTLETYNGTALIGTNEYTKTFAIPSSVKPTVSIAVSDPTGHLSTYGKYVQGKSKIKVVATASGSQGSTIKSYKTTMDGTSFSTATAEKDTIFGSGTLTIETTVTDSRGRTATATTTINVLPYSPPKITAMKAERTTGTQLKITFSSAVSSLKNGSTEKNTATYTLKYKKKTASSFTSVSLGYANNLAVTNGTKTITVEAGASYDVRIEVTDKFETIPKEISVSTAFKLWSWFKDGTGWAFGKIAELSGTLDIALPTIFRDDILIDDPELEAAWTETFGGEGG